MSEGQAEIPPGILRHLEANRERLRQLGVTQGLVDRMMQATADIIVVEKFLSGIILGAHRGEGWRARSRLKKSLRHGPLEHLGSCVSCRALAGRIEMAMLALLSPLDKTAPE